MGPMGPLGPRPDIFPAGLGYQQNPRGRLQSSKYMDWGEIDQILRIQWKSLHGGPPYIEDYYYLVRHSQLMKTRSSLLAAGMPSP